MVVSSMGGNSSSGSTVGTLGVGTAATASVARVHQMYRRPRTSFSIFETCAGLGLLLDLFFVAAPLLFTFLLFRRWHGFGPSRIREVIHGSGACDDDGGAGNSVDNGFVFGR